jgi:ABC-2 type transport system ATP-binding protein
MRMKPVKNQKTVKKSVENIVYMKDVASSEYFQYEDNTVSRVLENINLLIKSEECWGISGRSAFEIKLMLEIMANIRPYDSGKCVLAERGMMRHKRVILDHVFYIGSTDMIYNNMNVLEFLMFAMGRNGTNPVRLQDKIFEYILASGLGHISLTPVKLLTEEEKAVVILIVAAFSNSMLIVFNLPEYEFEDKLIEAVKRIAVSIMNSGKAFVLGTRDCMLIEKVCSHTAYIADGTLIYNGTVNDLRLKYDKIVLIIKDKNIHELKARLSVLLPEHILTVKNDMLLISGTSKNSENLRYIYKVIAGADLVPGSIEVNPKTVSNAYEEIVLQHDLQKQLF